jgi:hypothetical protein
VTPTGADVELDGNAYHASPMMLEPGRHHLNVSYEKYRPVKYDFNSTHGGSVQVRLCATERLDRQCVSKPGPSESRSTYHMVQYSKALSQMCADRACASQFLSYWTLSERGGGIDTSQPVQQKAAELCAESGARAAGGSISAHQTCNPVIQNGPTPWSCQVTIDVECRKYDVYQVAGPPVRECRDVAVDNDCSSTAVFTPVDQTTADLSHQR